MNNNRKNVKESVNWMTEGLIALKDLFVAGTVTVRALITLLVAIISLFVLIVCIFRTCNKHDSEQAPNASYSKEVAELHDYLACIDQALQEMLSQTTDENKRIDLQTLITYKKTAIDMAIFQAYPSKEVKLNKKGRSAVNEELKEIKFELERESKNYSIELPKCGQ